jgi:hypothetical protein
MTTKLLKYSYEHGFFSVKQIKLKIYIKIDYDKNNLEILSLLFDLILILHNQPMSMFFFYCKKVLIVSEIRTRDLFQSSRGTQFQIAL